MTIAKIPNCVAMALWAVAIPSNPIWRPIKMLQKNIETQIYINSTSFLNNSKLFIIINKFYKFIYSTILFVKIKKFNL